MSDVKRFPVTVNGMAMMVRAFPGRDWFVDLGVGNLSVGGEWCIAMSNLDEVRALATALTKAADYIEQQARVAEAGDGVVAA